jgi:AraC-like DNA-binding protein
MVDPVGEESTTCVGRGQHGGYMNDRLPRDLVRWPHWTGGELSTVFDPAEARRRISEAFAPATLDIHGPVDDFLLQLRMTEFTGSSLGHSRFGVNVSVAAPPPSVYVVCFARTGAIDVRSGRDVQVVWGGRGAVVDPHQITYFENWRPGSELVSLRIEREVLERRLTALTGQAPAEPIRFSPGLDMSTSQVASILRSLQMLAAESRAPGGLSADSGAAGVLSDLVATSLLVCQPHNYSDLLNERGKPCPPRTIREARDMVEHDPMSVQTVVEWAAAAHISVRSLEEGFQRYLGSTPMSYLRQIRLARAHEDLERADPREHTVAAIARRWGFHHLGRFSSVYRARYGVLPAETLKSAAGSLIVTTG